MNDNNSDESPREIARRLSLREGDVDGQSSDMLTEEDLSKQGLAGALPTPSQVVIGKSVDETYEEYARRLEKVIRAGKLASKPVRAKRRRPAGSPGEVASGNSERGWRAS